MGVRFVVLSCKVHNSPLALKAIVCQNKSSCIEYARFVDMDQIIEDQTARKEWIGLLAKAPAGRAAALFAKCARAPDFEWLRPPEIGSVMVRGRAGGTGSAFNLGEMTVTRCALRLTTGEIGHAYIQGRRKTDAETAALVDALMQTDMANDLQMAVLGPLSAEMADARSKRARKAAATKVDFFTMVRGED